MKPLFSIFLLLLIALPTLAQTNQAQNQQRCLNIADRLVYSVQAINPADKVAERFAFVSQNNPDKNVSFKATDMPPTDKITGSVSTVVIDGLVQWIEGRAKAEVRLWIMESLKRELCDKDTNIKDYFLQTCSTLSNLDVLTTAYSQQLLIDSLRNDLHDFPACAISKLADIPLGYQLQSVYDQYRDGENLEYLLYGLANSDELKDSLGQQPDNCLKPGDGKPSLGCGLVIPLLAYAAVIDTAPYWKAAEQAKGTQKQTKQMQAVQAFNTFFTQYLQRSGITLQEPSLNPQDFNKLHQYMQRIERLRQYTDDLLISINKLKATDTDEARNEAREMLFDITEATLESLSVARQLGFVNQQNIAARVQVTQMYLNAWLGAQSAISQREYVNGYLALEPILQCLTGEAPQPEDCPTALQLKPDTQQKLTKLDNGLRTAALLANAKDGDQFAESLDALASPVGAYRLRHKTSMWSINAYLGAEYGEYTLDVPEYGQVSYRSGEVFAPVGITWTHPNCGFLGACGVHAQLLNLGVLAGDFEGRIDYEGGTILSETSSSFRSVITPGLYAISSPLKNAPLTIGAGMSWGPVEYKTAELADGRMLPVEREQQFGVFVAIDLVMFRFGF
jgi:hypothetical protein